MTRDKFIKKLKQYPFKAKKILIQLVYDEKRYEALELWCHAVLYGGKVLERVVEWERDPEYCLVMEDLLFEDYTFYVFRHVPSLLGPNRDLTNCDK